MMSERVRSRMDGKGKLQNFAKNYKLGTTSQKRVLSAGNFPALVDVSQKIHNGEIRMETQRKGQNILRSILTGIGVAVLYLLIGTVLDYGITQILSQFFIADCSEDCYFKIFNSIFVLVALLSVTCGLRAGLRSSKLGK